MNNGGGGVKNIVASVLLLLALIGCSQLKEGVIVGKKCVPMHTIQTSTIIYVGKTATTIPSTQVIPDSWYVLIEGRIADGKLIRESHGVAKWYYDKVGVGDYYREVENSEWQQ